MRHVHRGLLRWLGAALLLASISVPAAAFDSACFATCMQPNEYHQQQISENILNINPNTTTNGTSAAASSSTAPCSGVIIGMNLVALELREVIEQLNEDFLPNHRTSDLVHVLLHVESSLEAARMINMTNTANFSALSGNSDISPQDSNDIRYSFSLARSPLSADFATPLRNARSRGLLGTDGLLLKLNLPTTNACAQACGSPIRALRKVVVTSNITSLDADMLEVALFSSVIRDFLVDENRLHHLYLGMNVFTWKTNNTAEPELYECSIQNNEGTVDLNAAAAAIGFDPRTCPDPLDGVTWANVLQQRCVIPSLLETYRYFFGMLIVEFYCAFVLISIILFIWYVLPNQRHTMRHHQRALFLRVADVIETTSPHEWPEWKTGSMNMREFIASLDLPDINSSFWTRDRLLEYLNWDHGVFNFFNAARGSERIVADGSRQWLIEIVRFVVGIVQDRKERLRDVLDTAGVGEHHIHKHPTPLDAVTFTYFVWDAIAGVSPVTESQVQNSSSWGPRTMFATNEIRSWFVNLAANGSWGSVQHYFSRLWFVCTVILNRTGLRRLIEDDADPRWIRRCLPFVALAFVFGVAIEANFFLSRHSDHLSDGRNMNFSFFWLTLLVPFVLRVAIQVVDISIRAARYVAGHRFRTAIHTRIRYLIAALIEFPLWMLCLLLFSMSATFSVLQMTIVNPVNVILLVLMGLSVGFVIYEVAQSTPRQVQVVLDVLNQTEFIRDGLEQEWPQWEFVNIALGAWRSLYDAALYFPPDVNPNTVFGKHRHAGTEDRSHAPLPPQVIAERKFFVTCPRISRIDAGNGLIKGLGVFEFVVRMAWNPLADGRHSLSFGWTDGARMIGVVCHKGRLMCASWSVSESQGQTGFLARENSKREYIALEILPKLTTLQDVPIHVHLAVTGFRPPEVMVTIPRSALAQQVGMQRPHIGARPSGHLDVEWKRHPELMHSQRSPLLEERVKGLANETDVFDISPDMFCSERVSFSTMTREYSAVSAWCFNHNAPTAVGTELNASSSHESDFPTSASDESLASTSRPHATAKNHHHQQQQQQHGEKHGTNYGAHMRSVYFTMQFEQTLDARQVLVRLRRRKARMGVTPVIGGLMHSQSFATGSIFAGKPMPEDHMTRRHSISDPPSTNPEGGGGGAAGPTTVVGGSASGALNDSGSVALPVSYEFLVEVLKTIQFSPRVMVILRIIELGFLLYFILLIYAMQKTYSSGSTDLRRSLIPLLASFLGAFLHRYSSTASLSREKVREAAHYMLRQRANRGQSAMTKHLCGYRSVPPARQRYFRVVAALLFLILLGMNIALLPAVITTLYTGGSIRIWESPSFSWLWLIIPD